MKRICRYLFQTRDKGLVFRPDFSKGLECFVDADWAGSWTKETDHDPLSANSRTGYFITYAGCPILWISRMQTLIALSTCEAEYIALSAALRDVIAIMNLLNELNSRGFKFTNKKPVITCKVFEDNASCIELAVNHKSRPRTKHLAIRLHHFRSYVTAKLITIQHVTTKEQLSDLMTKPLPKHTFQYLRDKIMGWNLKDEPPSATTAREGV